MADEKKPDFDPDKTVVDIRRPEPSRPADDDRTAVTPSHSQEPPSQAPQPVDEERTVMISRTQAEPPRSSADDSDKTMVGPRGGGGPDPGDRTMIRPSGATAGAQTAPTAGFQVVCLSGQARGKRFPIGGDEVVIGSNPMCQVQFPGIESLHAKLLRQPDGGYELHNVGTQGSVVMSGGRKPTRAKLKSGDLIKVGDVVLRYVQAGEVFSSDFNDAEFNAGIGNLFAPENRLYLALGAAVLLVAIVLLWPSGGGKTVLVQKSDTSAGDKRRKEEVNALLQSGEVLFNAGKLISPADQPDADSAFAKFNEALALDPGNEQALAWLKKIDEDRDKQRRAREEAEKQRVAEEQARRDRQHQELAKKVEAIVAQGDEFYDKGQVTEPPGTNALVKYREALKVDPESALAQARVQKAVGYYVQKGDDLRDKNELWPALENYRKASRATDGRDEEVEKRMHDLEGQLKAGMAGTNVKLVIYKDDKGQLFVLDDMDKVPARYKDRALEVNPAQPKPGAGGLR